MAVLDPNGDPDVLRVWTMLSEVSEQLSQNRSSAVNLHAIADGAKAQAIHSQSGFVLRRFNLDKSKEVYDEELERMNSAMSAENQMLLNDNRQLSALIREYEQTLENIMATFRTRAHEVQQRELALMRQYESVIIQRETEALNESLTINNARSESLARAGRMLRAVLRRLGGEDVRVYEAHEAYLHALQHGGRSGQSSREASSTSTTSTAKPEERINEETDEGSEGSRKDKGKERDDGSHPQEDDDAGQSDLDRILEEEDDPEKRLAAAEWALDRECELARLERENEELRALVDGLLKPANSNSTPATQHPSESTASTAPIPIPDHPNGEDEGRASDDLSTLPRPQQHRLLGGRPGTVGPFGTYKKTTVIRVDSR
ncbi:hypothetical protein C8Q76DRAFT_635132 [Earliella scabrosa]|nr:hypothetical protein C8Q76DRAFT_635132 [Earliella scabrosa]